MDLTNALEQTLRNVGITVERTEHLDYMYINSKGGSEYRQVKSRIGRIDEIAETIRTHVKSVDGIKVILYECTTDGQEEGSCKARYDVVSE